MKFHYFFNKYDLYLRAQAKFCITIKFKVIYLAKIYKHIQYRDPPSHQIYTAPETKDYPPSRFQNEITTLIIISHDIVIDRTIM